MKQITFLFCFGMLLFSCNNEKHNNEKSTSGTSVQLIKNEQYELHLPDEEIKGVLVLFGGYPETPADINREFNILERAKTEGFALILMTFNKRLWLEENEKNSLSIVLQEAFKSNNLPFVNIYIGGFSSGGNVSLLLSNQLINEGSTIQPKGVFIVDSPVDLFELYNCSRRNLERNFSEISMRESARTVESFDSFFGKPENGLEKYEQYSPFVSKTNNIDNLKFLDRTKIRLYTEPDTLWWKENRQNDYEDLNAFSIKRLSIELENTLANPNIELIETTNKGYRANGIRHPHSWSIVDQKDLFAWMLSDNSN